MKIGLVCPYNINKHGGVLEVVLSMKVELERRGHTVKIITPQPRNQEFVPSPDIIFAGTSTDFRTLTFTETTSQVSSTADAERVQEILSAEQFDILHFHEPWQPLLSRQLLQLSTCVNIGTFHAKVSDAMMSRSILKVVYPYLKSVLNSIDVLTAVSPSGADYVSSMTDRHIDIIPNGIDLHKYQPKKTYKTPDRQFILFVGRLERRKGVNYLLRAFQIFSAKNPDIDLLIAGDGPDREKLELLTEDLKLNNVHFLGYIEEKEKIRLMHEASLFCSPALYGESFGIVLLESMASGTICLAGNNSGYIDLMKGVGALSIINPDDKEEFARRLDLLLHEEPLKKAWKTWAKEYVKNYDYSLVVDQYEALYIDSLEKHAHNK